MKTGKKYFGYPGKDGFNPSRAESLHPELQKLIDRTKDAAMKDLSNPADLASRGTFESWDVDTVQKYMQLTKPLKMVSK